MSFASDRMEWTPSDRQWEVIKRRSTEKMATVTVRGARGTAPEKTLSAGSACISTSSDEVGAPLFFREVNLPFLEAAEDPSHIQWRFGPVSSKNRPPVVLGGLPVCGNCHSFSADGKTLGMEVDSGNDKGAYAVVPVEGKEADRLVKTTAGTYQYDLYRIPFNGGKGGKAEPLKGASHNGMSNFFAKYSPDGKWIVFCKARSYMLLQPDSQLYIVPAEGGQARRLRCNTHRMNSWHSWSPNGRWLVFSSKANGPYTQLWLTHIDEQGRDTPAVVLDRLTAPDRAANIPEFVNRGPGDIKRIREQYLDGLRK